jgi:hypothetical protein
MSAYIVSDWTMQRAVAALVESGLPENDASNLGRRLWALNASAVEQRYPSNHEEMGTHEAWQAAEGWTWRPGTDTRFYSRPDADGWEGNAWKSLSEVHYQCAEGDVPNHPLFQLIRQALEAREKAPKRPVEAAPSPVPAKPVKLWLREFSPCGPCLDLGEVVRITPKGVAYRDRSGRLQRRGGRAWKPDGTGRLHTTPCHSCMDHPHTQYPNGYMG